MRQSQKRKKNSLSKVPLKRYLFVLYRLLVGWGKTVFAGGVLMLISRVQLAGFLDDEFMTDGLAEDVAKVFINWLIERAEKLVVCEKNPVLLKLKLQRLATKGRSIRKILVLWEIEGQRANAHQLLAAEELHEVLEEYPSDCMSLLLRIVKVLTKRDRETVHSVPSFGEGSEMRRKAA